MSETTTYGDLPPALNATGLEDNALATSQEGIVLAFVCGSAACPGRWLSPIYNQYATLAPQERPPKK